MKTIEELLISIEKDLISEQKKRGIFASGKSAKSLRHEIDEKSGSIYGEGYFYQQENGRSGGKMPPFQSIYDWLQYKKYNFDWQNDRERRSMAFAIMKKIANRGTFVYSNRAKGLPISFIIQKNVSIFRKSIMGNIQTTVFEELSKKIQ